VVQPDNTIRLKVTPEVSALDFANAVTVGGTTVPATSNRRADTIIELKDGQSFGIAGLMDQRVISQFAKIPGIGDIPILGQLFRSKSVTRSKSELLVLVTPNIIDPLTGVQSPLAVPTAPLKMLDQEKFDKGMDNVPPKSESGTSSH
jgi:pilus assembly protein CpaC